MSLLSNALDTHDCYIVEVQKVIQLRSSIMLTILHHFVSNVPTEINGNSSNIMAIITLLHIQAYYTVINLNLNEALNLNVTTASSISSCFITGFNLTGIKHLNLSVCSLIFY